jgi:hypothetical protein
MNLELERIAPLRAANVSAIVYGTLTAAFAAVLAVIWFLVPSQAQQSGETQQTVHQLFGFVFLLYPILGAISGWLMGLLGAAVYNVVSVWLGGLRLEFAEASVATRPGT